MNQEKIGSFISECRKKKNLTQEQLASIIGVSNRTISKWENGNNMPDYAILPLLCETLDITINELLSGEKLKQENYQKKLEENIILNMAELKKRTKKTFFFIVKLIIFFILIFIVLTILEFVLHFCYYYRRSYLSNEDIKVILCTEKDSINVSIEAKDHKPIWMDFSYDVNSKTYRYKPYRIRKKAYMKGYSSVDLSRVTNISDINSIKVLDKTVYEKGMKLDVCNLE